MSNAYLKNISKRMRGSLSPASVSFVAIGTKRCLQDLTYRGAYFPKAPPACKAALFCPCAPVNYIAVKAVFTASLAARFPAQRLRFSQFCSVPCEENSLFLIVCIVRVCYNESDNMIFWIMKLGDEKSSMRLR